MSLIVWSNLQVFGDTETEIKMTPEDFIKYWGDTPDTLSPIAAHRIDNFKLLAETKHFLNSAGLPTYAQPNLSFIKDTDHIYHGIQKLSDQYDFLEEEYSKYIVIGSCRDGDPIAINCEENDIVEVLDHEDYFSSMFFNSSISNLAEFLLIYKEFEESILVEHGSKGLSNGYFTDIQYTILLNKMTGVDNLAINMDGFWKSELDILLNLRQDYMDNK